MHFLFGADYLVSSKLSSFCVLLRQGSRSQTLERALLWSQEFGSSAADTTITDRVYFDVMECPSLARSDRTLGNTSLICTDGEDLGRIVIGLYGKQVCYLSCLQLSSTYLDTSQTFFCALKWYLSTSSHWLFHRGHRFSYLETEVTLEDKISWSVFPIPLS